MTVRSWSAGPTPLYGTVADRAAYLVLGGHFRPRPASVAAVALLLSASAAARGQSPNLLVSVELNGQRRTVEAVLTADSALLLPAADVHALLGLDPPAATWTTLPALRHAWPPVSFTWLPRELRVVVDDPTAVLPATRARRAALTRQARGAPPLAVTRGGPFAAVVADDAGRSLVDLGYSWRGRVAVTARRSSTFGTAWAVSLAPLPALFVTYTDGERSLPSATARVAVGPAWAFATWTPGRWSVDGLVSVGRVSLFASSRDAFVITFRGPVAVQLGRAGSVATGRVSVGPVPPSPFVVPVVR